MPDVTQIGGFLDWVFNTFKNDLFGSSILMFFFIATAVIVLLVLMRASKFVFIGFFAAALLGLSYFGFMYMAWIPAFVWVIIGIAIAVIILALMRVA